LALDRHDPPIRRGPDQTTLDIVRTLDTYTTTVVCVCVCVTLSSGRNNGARVKGQSEGGIKLPSTA